MVKSVYKNVLLTGIPRSGTTLCCHLLNQLPNVLALHEPMSPADFCAEKGRAAACQQVLDFADTVRQQVHDQGKARSSHRDGKIPDNPIEEQSLRSGLRKPNIAQGEIDVSSRHLTKGFSLVIKHNALFTALLPELQESLPVYAVIRNPLAVLCSWSSVDLPVNRGRIPAGEKFDHQLKKKLDDCDDCLDRQLILLDWMFGIFNKYIEKDNILRYEEVVKSPKTLLRLLENNATESSMQAGKNKNAAYSDLPLLPIYERLLAMESDLWEFYSRDDIHCLYAEMVNNKL